MQFDHIAWRSERASIHDKNRPVEVEVLSEMAGSLTIIGRAPGQRRAFEQVVTEATRRGLPTEGLGDAHEYRQGTEPLDHWCAATWLEAR